MKVGGNASANDFFSRHGGSTMLNDADTKIKYSSRIAELYREELAKRVKEDAIKSVSDIPTSLSSKLTVKQISEWNNGRWHGIANGSS